MDVKHKNFMHYPVHVMELIRIHSKQINGSSHSKTCYNTSTN